MKTKVSKCFLMLAIMFCIVSASSQNLNIGNLVSLKVSNNVIYVAGQGGIAALKPDLTVLWQKQLPETTIRLLEINDGMIAYSSYVYAGRNGQLFSSFSSLWDKVTFTDNELGALDLNGQQKWSSTLNGASKLSIPAIGNGIVTVMSNDSLYIFNGASGALKTKTYNSMKFLLGKSIKDHALPNQPLIAKDAIFTASPFKFSKIDLNGQIVKQKDMYGIFSQLPVMTVAPILFDGKIFVANAPTGQRGQKDGVARLFSIKDNLDKEWDEYVDMSGQTGVSSLTHNSNALFVATNFDLMAFNVKGKKLWENKKDIGLPLLRGVRYSGNMGVKNSDGNFLCADENAVYIASGKKVKKEFVKNITILDTDKGKIVKTIEVADVVIDMALLDNALVYITESNKVVVVNK
jgi:outer membrane protein assembly factor BamB